MKEKKSIGFGFRGWMLMLYQFLAYIGFVCFTNWPMNALGDVYGGTQSVAQIYTIAAVVGVVFQVIASPFIGKIKSIHTVSVVMGVVSVAAGLGVMLVPPTNLALWKVFYFIACLFIIVWSTFVIGILIGQWFPRRKGVVMGLVTISFPIGNALMGPVLGKAMGMGMEGVPGAVIAPVIRSSYLPFIILVAIGVVIGAFLVRDYPEQVGAFRDNDKSMTPEKAKAMMEFEIENKRTSVWGLGHTLASPDFWLIALPAGFLLIGAVGMMTQTANIFGSVGIIPGSNEFNMVMMVNAVFAIAGSYLLGILDAKIGTRKSMLIAMALMVVSGILGVVGATGHNKVAVIAAMWILGIFMGASSNYTVSASVQYWRIEDFPTVFGKVNPLANFMNNLAPVIITSLMFMNAAQTGGHADPGPAFAFLAIAGVVSLVMLALFKPARVKKYDDKYRTAAGKPLDDALVGRK